MSLPDDFEDLLALADARGHFDDTSQQLRDRLAIAVGGREKALPPALLAGGGGQWVTNLVANIESAVRREICGDDGLKGPYEDKLSKESVRELAKVLIPVLTAINPTLAVSSVALYVAMWVLRVGLNEWCAQATDGA